MIKKIKIEIIPHEAHRYETVGDYFYPTCIRKEVRVSDMKNEDFEFLVYMHELIESHLCRKRGIPEPDIMNFDLNFEENRPKGNTDEPGDSPYAPYHKEHLYATKIERTLAKELGVDWDEYEKTVNSL